MTDRPLVWTSRVAGAAVAIPIAWLLSIELGSSRTASRHPEPGDVEIDSSTSRICDVSFVVALVGAVAASAFGRRCTITAQRTAVVAGVVALVGAGALSTSARRHLGRFHRDTLTLHADHELVDTGPYRRVRHPLYTATIGVFVGLGLALGHWVSVTLAALPTAALVHRIRVEERMLADRFGGEYDSYRRRTARLVPRVW